jgi:DNA-binding NtrC family response regulator
VIAATNRDLVAGVLAGTFRHDLFYRLNVVQIRVPALRERNADIPLLAHYFLKKFSGPVGHVKAISDGAIRRLMAYDWPGNIREPQNAMESAIALTSHSILTTEDLASNPNRASSHLHKCHVVGTPAEVERQVIVNAVLQGGGDKLAAARLLASGKQLCTAS